MLESTEHLCTCVTELPALIPAVPCDLCTCVTELPALIPAVLRFMYVCHRAACTDPGRALDT